jgi:tRNA(Ile)-lysidine synthase
LSEGKKGSHPPSLIRLVRRTLEDECQLQVGQRLLLAVSGGGDSTALLHVMAGLAEERGLLLFAHGVDHRLRPESAAELDLVEALAERLGVSFSRTEITVAHGNSPQAKAREGRYAALRARATELGGALIVTAHHADDRAETVLIRLLRGSGLEGLGVLPAQERDLLRPMIRARRRDVTAHLQRHGLEYATDPSNQNPKYQRSRVRHELLPLLDNLAPRIIEQLCHLADEAVALKAERGGEPVGVLGRRQRLALERAIAKRQVNFELPLAEGLLLALKNGKVQ